MADSSSTIEAAMLYASYGWRVIPCDLKTKHPPLNGWQKLATTDEDQLIEWWSNGHAGAGVSLVFGPSSGIIDIDCDDPADGDKLRDLAFGGEWPITPTYLSGNRKTPHRLFCWRDDLPDRAHVDLRRLAGLDIDLKLGAGDKGTHSLAPPSKGYEWLPGLSPEECDVADLPDSFVSWIHNLLGGGVTGAEKVGKSIDEWVRLASGVAQGSRNDALASFIGEVVRQFKDINSRRSVEIIVGSAMGWNQSCEPPLSEDEVRRTVASIIRKEVQRRGDEAFENFAKPSTDQATAAAKGGESKGFQIIRVLGDPVTYELHHRTFESSGGFLRLTARQIVSGHDIRVQAAEQAGVGLPPAFSKAWGEHDGLFVNLMAAADVRQGDREIDRRAVVAQAVMEQLEVARPSRIAEGMSPEPSGCPTLLSDGSYMIGRGVMQRELSYDSRKVTRDEISSLMKAVGGVRAQPRVSGKRLRVWHLNSDAWRQLERVAWPEDGDQSHESAELDTA